MDHLNSRGIPRQAWQESGQEDDGKRNLATLAAPTSPASEAYRSLRTNLLYAVVDNPPKTIVLTSPGPGEGKSTTCANLGVVLAEAARSTLILDCDFRRPVIHKYFGIRNLHGIISVLQGEYSPQDIWYEPVEDLKVIPVGPIPLKPAETLGTKRFADFLASARERFDYVLIDASPIGLVSDPAILATQADGVLLIIDAEGTRKGAVRQAIRKLTAVNANIIGTVVNNIDASRGDYYYYDSYTYDHLD